MASSIHWLTTRIPQLQRTNLRFLGEILSTPSQRKHILRWLHSLQNDYLLRYQMPWIAYDAIDYLTDSLGDAIHVFEFGSGGSTLFWSHYASLCVSIEHNQEWFRVVSERVQTKPHIDLRLILPEPREQLDSFHDPSDPARYLSDDAEFHDFSFRTYVEQIDAYPDSYFDVLLIDGRARPSCIAHGARKVKIGGMLILDNADRSYYINKTERYLSSFDKRLFLGVTPQVPVLTTTCIFTRRS
ncbi:MAG: hypothetical protein KJZ86_02635 [Caldilineaceae bacterium]|nr:hypothetical protein [Caldilineaceae bacterium]HRJ40482.1 hypothetical protein [Caldilineaceae bacterium]